MDDTEFYRTVMGRRFFDVTMPELVKQLARLNENIEKLIAVARTEPHGSCTDDGAAPDERPRP
jgi:chaperonin cofactor prefoldin